ncbi:MAG: GspH/FimT family pseudopilin [Oceanospirillaceae bacterium]|nr:GspH/FimT family pseudopilin [Oceanospirillaceae bacterium]
MKPSRQAGFTLLELMVVLVVASLMLSLVVPRFAAVLPGVELKSYTQKTAALLRNLRSQAMAESRLVALSLDTEAHQMRVSGRDAPISVPQDIRLTLNDDGSLALGNEIVLPEAFGVSESLPSIRFYPDGSSSGGDLTLSSGGGGYAIRVDWLTGQVSIDDGTDEQDEATADE